MKLTDKTKKRLTIAGLGVVCVVLVIAIASQFKTEVPKDVTVQPSSTVSDMVSPSTSSVEPRKAPETSVQPIYPTAAPTQSTDTGDSTGTKQSIQAEVTKPPEPPQEVLTDPSKTPDGETVDKATPAEKNTTTKAERGTSSSTPKSGDKKDGKIYVPGFGWIDDNGGGGSGTTAGDMYENGNKIGNMD
jgi:type IV secretory pathway VirB10-like protein